AIVELLRILLDSEGMHFEAGWEICRRSFAFTNHTLVPEELERWSMPLLNKVLPRHLELIVALNQRFLSETVHVRWPGDASKVGDLSLIEDSNPKMIRMAHLAVLGSHTTNGVAASHTRVLVQRTFPGFAALYPARFQNKTSGISPRRWLKVCNPGLAELIDATIGLDWPKDLDRLRQLDLNADDPAFQEAFLRVKTANKQRLARTIHDVCGIEVDPEALFDVQVSPLQEHRRHHLNLLHILTRYQRLLNDQSLDTAPRLHIFAGKAAPGAVLAKQIVHCINAVAATINNDQRINAKMRVAFLPNYSVSLAELIIPAADLSEQISTAGKETSGMGGMKLALNGAITIGTPGGANVEIHEEVGSENIFMFGLDTEEADALKRQHYDPRSIYEVNEELRAVIDWLDSGHFSAYREATNAVKTSLLDHGDPFLVLADFDSYVDCQSKVDRAFLDRPAWAGRAIRNTARMSKFSSDRTVLEYANQIWRLPQVQVKVPSEQRVPEQ
ncbi:MAG: glycogen/starch/alpha-glucan family phosphorylase, partial [Verrucomicrobiales bacterium]